MADTAQVLISKRLLPGLKIEVIKRGKKSIRELLDETIINVLRVDPEPDKVPEEQMPLVAPEDIPAAPQPPEKQAENTGEIGSVSLKISHIDPVPSDDKDDRTF